MAITEQEANILKEQQEKVLLSDLLKRLIEQVAFEARSNEYVDKKSGVSARLTISAYENAVSTAERRAILHGDKSTMVWVSDLSGIIPSITGKIELVYEGEQEGPYQVAINLVDKSIRTTFAEYFPDPESIKKRRNTGKASAQTKAEDSPYKTIIGWFDAGNKVDMLIDATDRMKIDSLYAVSGLHALVSKHYATKNEMETALLMEFVLFGLSAYSLISKKTIEGRIEFKDLMGSMLNFGSGETGSDELEEDDFN
jgi:magnesium chelatase subunit I